MRIAYIIQVSRPADGIAERDKITMEEANRIVTLDQCFKPATIEYVI